MLLADGFIAVLLLSLLSVVTTIVGVLLAALVQGNRGAIAAGIGFSTGIMVLVAAPHPDGWSWLTLLLSFPIDDGLSLETRG